MFFRAKVLASVGRRGQKTRLKWAWPEQSGKPCRRALNWGQLQDALGQAGGRSPRWVSGQGAWLEGGVAGSWPEKDGARGRCRRSQS